MGQVLMPPDNLRDESNVLDNSPQMRPSRVLMPPDNKAGALSNLRSMSGISPEQALSDIRLGGELGMPPDMVGMNRPDAQRMKVERDIQQTDSPLFDEWMAQNPYNTAIGAGDLRGLADIFNYVGTAKSALKTVARLPGIAAEGVYGTIGLVAGGLDYMEEGSARLAKAIGLNDGQRTGVFGAARDWAQRNADTIRREFLESEALSLPEELQGRLWDNPEYLLNPEYLTFQLGEAANSLAVMLAGGAGYSLARGGALTAQTLARTGPVAGGLMEASPMYSDLLKEGVSNERALSGAMAFGVVVGLLEKIGLDKILEGPGGKGLLRGVRDFFIAGSKESVTEYAEEPAQAVLSGLARGDSAEQILEDFFDSLTNVDVVPGAFMLGGGAHRVSQHIQSSEDAKVYSESLMNIYDKVEASSIKHLSPAHMQSVLEFASPDMRVQVALPADAALELYQQGVDILSPLGLSEQDAVKAAAQGQDLLVTAAKLPAYLDRQQMEAAAKIVRRVPEAMSAEDAARLDERVAEDAAMITELYQAQAAEMDAFEQQLEALRAETASAIQNAPGLKAQAEAMGGLEQYVDDWLNTVKRFAMRMAAAGQNPVEVVQRIFLNKNKLGQAQETDGQTLFQPLNPGVDLNATVPVVEVQPMFSGQNPLVLRKRFPATIKKQVLESFPVVNEEQGVTVRASGKKFHEYLKIAEGENALNHLEAISALPDLMRTARLIESSPDKDGDPFIKRVHRYRAAFRIDNKDYSVRLVVFEYTDGQQELDRVDSLYHLKLEKEMPTGISSPTLLDSNSGEATADIDSNAATYPGRLQGNTPRTPPAKPSGYSLRQLLDGVKDSEGINYFQAKTPDSARGKVEIYPEGYLVSLFKNADLSTLLHETGHIFFEEMERVIQAGAADETMLRDYATLRKWVGGEPDAPLSVEQKERLARGFEAYLMEGKAPAEDLKSGFSRFRAWMLKIYRQAVNLKVELNDEVRGVFDRMLATEKEIAAAAASNELLDLTAGELDSLGFSGTARYTAARLMPKAREAAAESLRAAREQNRKQRLAKYHKEISAEVKEEPVYRARFNMRKTPLDLRAVRENYGDEATDALLKKVPGGLRNDGGIDPEIFAAEHGFESGVDMVTQMLATPTLKEAVGQRVQEKEARHDAEYEAFEHLLETREVAVQMEMVGRKLAELVKAEHIEREAYLLAAQREIAAMPLGRATQTGNFLAAMRRALRRERQAINSGDRQAALTAHRQAMLNLEFVRLSRDIARLQGVIERRIKRFASQAKANPDARYIVMDIGARYGLSKANAQLAEGRDGSTTRGWIETVAAAGYNMFLDDRVLYGQGQPAREMNVADFEALAETVNQIVIVERNQRQVMTAQGKRDLQDVANTVASTIYASRKPKALKTVERQPGAVKSLKGLHAIHTKIEALCISLDGDKLGAVWDTIYKPINDAEDRQLMRLRGVRDALRGEALFGAYTRKELAAMGGKKALVKEVGEKLTRENRLAVALNMGNETNINRIKEGHGWNDEQINSVISTLTRRDWEFVQAVWDYIATFKEEAFALQEEVIGLRPKSVEAQALAVQTADGHILQLRGGYYPIKYNAEKSFTAFQREQKEMDKQLFGGRNHGAAMTKNGHLKERAAGGNGSPLLLELSVITDHLFNVVHDLEYRRAVLDVAKVLRHNAVREAIESTVGQELYRELLPWLQDVANERQEPMHQIHRWARWARASASVMQMGYKVTTMFTQPLGFTQSIELLGYKDASAGLKAVYGNPLNFPRMLEETFARSVFMANRVKNFDREVRDFSKRLQPGMGRFAWVEATKDNAFVPMGLFQMSVDLPTWWGGYIKGLRENGGDEQKAAQYADSVVRMSQGSGSTKDLARVQRGGDLMRLATMFYSYFNTMYNLGARRIALLKQNSSPKNIFLAANTALLLWFVPAVLSELVAGRGPDDNEEPEEWALMNILQYPFQAVVGVRDIANAVFGEYGYQITPAQSAPKSLVNWFKAVSRALEKEDAGEMVKPTVEAAGYLFGLPMKQPIITVGNLWDYITGEDPDFEVRDLFFVKPKGRR